MLTLRHPDQPSQPVGPAWLVLIARDITALGGYTFLFLLTGLLVLYFGLKRQPAPLLLLLAIILGGTAINRVMKFFLVQPCC